MSEPVLAQDEIDALLNGVNGIAGQAETAADPEGIRAYNLGHEMRSVRGQMPALDEVNERFARLLRVSLYAVLRRSAEVATNPVELKPFSEYLQTLHLPSSLNLVRFNPLRGTGLIVLEPRLVFAIVDTVFGGSGRQATIEGRDFTATESRIVRAVLDRAFTDLKEAWSHVHPLEPEYISSEMNPQFVAIVSPTEVVAVSSFKIDIDGVSGELHVTMPYSMIEPLRELLEAGAQSDRADRDERWTNTLHNEILDATVELRAAIGASRVQIARLNELQPGDIIPLDFNGHATLMVDGTPLFTGRLGASRGRCAVQLQGNARVPRGNGPSALSALQAQSNQQNS